MIGLRKILVFRNLKVALSSASNEKSSGTYKGIAGQGSPTTPITTMGEIIRGRITEDKSETLFVWCQNVFLHIRTYQDGWLTLVLLGTSPNQRKVLLI